jgi:glycerol-3-phosphate dehydrogenase
MAEHAVDAAVTQGGLTAGPCCTTDLPLVGAASRPDLHLVRAPARLVRRFGTEAPDVVADAVAVTGRTEEDLLRPVSADVPVTRAELVWGVTHEGALDLDDLLDRRTRVGLVAAHRKVAEEAAREALTHR